MKRVMFVCKKNSARSQMADAFANKYGEGKITVTSSGLEKSQVNPGAINAMDAIGMDIRNQTSNALSEFRSEDFDVVISLCGCGVNLPLDWTKRELFEDWQLEDPAEKPELFPEVRDEVERRVRDLIDRVGV
jgi:arsenate reductase (thioredoxin)